MSQPGSFILAGNNSRLTVYKGDVEAPLHFCVYNAGPSAITLHGAGNNDLDVKPQTSRNIHTYGLDIAVDGGKQGYASGSYCSFV